MENLFHDRPKKPREHKTGATKGQAVSEQQVIDTQCGQISG